jgi:hypothetical protein
MVHMSSFTVDSYGFRIVFSTSMSYDSAEDAVKGCTAKSKSKTKSTTDVGMMPHNEIRRRRGVTTSRLGNIGVEFIEPLKQKNKEGIPTPSHVASNS